MISLITLVPSEVKEAASTLRCSSLLLVNILGVQELPCPYHWLYVYDEGMYSTRISQTHLLAPSNTPEGLAGLQIEVYSPPYRPFRESHAAIAAKVVEEVCAMRLINEPKSMHYQFVPYANVIFDHQRRKAQDTILSFLCSQGLVREYDDLEPMTDWQHFEGFASQPTLALSGRFGQWKYFWSDDCILRGLEPPSLVFSMIPRRQSDQDFFVADIYKAFCLLDWRPWFSSEAVIRSMLEWTGEMA